MRGLLLYRRADGSHVFKLVLDNRIYYASPHANGWEWEASMHTMRDISEEPESFIHIPEFL